MELAVHFIDFLPGDPAKLGPTLADAAKAAEQGGATLFTLADHFFQMENLWPAENPFLEGYTSLGFLAAQTTTIELSLLVTGVTYRYPGVLAKAVTTLDVLSQGRLGQKTGSGWYAYGADRKAQQQYDLFAQRRRVELEAKGEAELAGDLKLLEHKAKELAKGQRKRPRPGKPRMNANERE